MSPGSFRDLLHHHRHVDRRFPIRPPFSGAAA
jgi:hypothetical protein